MSDPEGFLARWSRLKREGSADVASPPATAADVAGEPASSVKEEAPSPEPPEPVAVDLAALPPIESITAATDIRAFLAPGIPAQLVRAALRRAWEADPAIRDFVGLAENAWDFNAPDGVPGFGPLAPTEGLQQVIAQASEEPPRRFRLSGNEEESPASSAAGPDEEPALAPPDSDAPSEEPNFDAALQKEEAEGGPIPLPPRHGGALPR